MPTHSSRRQFLKAAGLAVAGTALPRRLRAAPAKRPARRPNIVFFLADDMGWMDSSVYGSQYYDTPNMERLAKRGMRFTDAYAANPLCSPTRASILTGKFPARLRITTPAGHLPPLPPDRPLLAAKAGPSRKIICPISRRFLPPAEYTIGEALRDAGYRTGFVGKWHLGLRPEHWPETQGFDLSFHGAPDPGPRSFFSPYQFRAGTVTDGPKGEYITDRLTAEAVKYMEANRKGPFFLCLWHYAVHAPWGHKEEITKRYRGKVDPRGKQNNPVMASMLKSLDESLGRVLDTLDRLKLTDNTIIIFMSDNGGNVHEIVEGHPPTNNAPLRGGKAMIYEGGTREPMLVAWPGTVRPGSTCSEMVQSIDFYPTLLDMAGVAPKEGKLLDGESIVPLLKQTGSLKRDAIFCHFPHGLGRLNYPSTYVRQGPWKLIRFYHDGPNGTHRYELYNLTADISETTNLADKHPARVKQMDALIDGFLKRTDALVPIPNPNYNPKMAPVDGWRPSRQCTLSRHEGALRITSTGQDPFVMTGHVPRKLGPMTVQFRMRSESKGAARVYWGTGRHRGFAFERSAPFKPIHDGKWHDYAVKFAFDTRLQAFRIDPSTGPGILDLDWVRLVDAQGTVLRQWDFAGK